ncbi:MFS transporter [Streptomyces sp. MST-110588]|uniref:MFS transporter n=1 Tax=Streptomyces sp. MST-110588 TaxID=2833628 RepID=UPI001F5DDEFF|nr:MFS transporter [Streptomyces sp. MST-110588]UNO41387.1 MFS transporter [Streptomyces sp. MST-110588]
MNNRPRQAGWLLAAVLTTQFMVSLDMSVVAIALPDMGRDLGFTPDGLQWVVNAYALAFGGLLMLGGRLADVLGRRRTLLAGLLLFGAASLAGGLVGTPGALIAARAAQGVGAAALAPVALALLTVTYPAGPARSRALGLWGMAGAAGGAFGVLAGGLLTEATGWRSVMLVNVPFVLFALLAAVRSVPADRDGGPRPRLDLAGAVLVTLGTTVLVWALARTETEGWTSPWTVTALAAAALLLAAFAAVESRTRQPLLRLGLLTRRPVLAGNLFTLLLSSGQFAAFFFCSLYMQQVLRFGETAAGLAFLPFCAGVVIGSLIAPRAITRLGTGRLLALGGLLGGAGFAWFAATMHADGSFLTSILGPSLLTSVGVGMSFVPLGTAATTGVVPQEAGMASGLLNTARQIGGSLGLAVLVTVAANASGPHPDRPALAAGYATAFTVSAALLVLAALVALALLPHRPTPASAAPEGPPASDPTAMSATGSQDIP